MLIEPTVAFEKQLFGPTLSETDIPDEKQRLVGNMENEAQNETMV